MVDKAYVLGITLTPSLNPLQDIHCTEVLGALDYLNAQSVDSPELADCIVIPAQISVKEALDKIPGFEAKLPSILARLEVIARLNLPIFYVMQDPRARFLDILKELAFLENATILSTFDSEYAINSAFGPRGAKYLPYKNFLAAQKFKYSFVYAGFQFDEYRKSIFNKYANGLACVGIGKTDNLLPSITGNKKVGATKLIEMVSQSAATILLYNKEHVELGFWHTTRLFQGLSWGTLLIVPKEYSHVVQGTPSEAYNIVENAGQTKALLHKYLHSKSFRQQVLNAQAETFNQLVQ